MMGICGECGSEKEHKVMSVRMGLRYSWIKMKCCDCGHEWDEQSDDPEIGGAACRECEDI
jgi:hypothetical protein